jgi:hypothetical protein
MADDPAKKAAKKAAKKGSSAKKAAAAKKPAGAKRVASSAKAAVGKRTPAHDEIAVQAYHIYERDGGDAVENWLRAERELSDG